MQDYLSPSAKDQQASICIEAEFNPTYTSLKLRRAGRVDLTSFYRALRVVLTSVGVTRCRVHRGSVWQK